MKRSEILKIRNEAKKLLDDQKKEMDEAHSQGLMTVQEITENVSLTKIRILRLAHFIDDKFAEFERVQ